MKSPFLWHDGPANKALEARTDSHAGPHSRACARQAGRWGMAVVFVTFEDFLHVLIDAIRRVMGLETM